MSRYWWTSRRRTAQIDAASPRNARVTGGAPFHVTGPYGEPAARDRAPLEGVDAPQPGDQQRDRPGDPDEPGHDAEGALRGDDVERGHDDHAPEHRPGR